MMAGIERLEGLPEVVRDSNLRTVFRTVGDDHHIIHTRGKTYRAQQSKETWAHKENLGSGGQGSVDLQVKVGETKTPQFRAVKSIRVPERELESNADFYIRELETIIKFSHARYGDLFVKTYGWFTSKSTLYIAMEYYALGDLQAYLLDATKCSNTRLPEDQAHDISCQILDALFIMHEERFAHRDIKPANILITSHYPGPWTVKLGDFGISKRDEDVTIATTAVRGTLRFMPPELLGYGSGNSRSVNLYAADMWCLGETIFRLITGQATFANQAELFKFHFGQAEFPTHVLKRLDVSDEAVDFISSLIISEPLERLTAETATRHPWVGEELVASDHGSVHWSDDPRDHQLGETLPSASWPTEFAQPQNTQRVPSPPVKAFEQQTAVESGNSEILDRLNDKHVQSNLDQDVHSWKAPAFDLHSGTELQSQLPDTLTPLSSPNEARDGLEHETTKEPENANHQPSISPTAMKIDLSADGSLQQRSNISAKQQSGEPDPSSARQNDGPAKMQTTKAPSPSALGDQKELRKRIQKTAEMLYHKGEYDAASNTYQNLIDIKTQSLVGSTLDEELLDYRQSLADTLYAKNDLIGADEQYGSVLHGRRFLLGETHPDVLRSMQNYATILFERGKYQEAEILYASVVETRTQVIGLEHPDTLNTMHDLADTLAKLGKVDDAAKAYRSVIKLRNKIQDVGELESLQNLVDFSAGLETGHNLKIQLGEMERLVQLKERTLGAENRDTLDTKLVLADMNEWEDRKVAAGDIYTQVTKVAEDVYGQHSQFAVDCRLRLADFQNRWNWEDVQRGTQQRTESVQALHPGASVGRRSAPPKKNVWQRLFN